MKKANTHLIWLCLLCFTLNACFKAEPTSSHESASQSAIDVKQPSQSIDLKPLSGDLNASTLPDVAKLYGAKAYQVEVEDTGRVVKLFADDTNGLKHQKFLVKVASGQTLLFAHNIELAKRIDEIAVGDTITFRGEYVYNPKGDVVHWTHHDPSGHHPAGWIQLNGKIYE
jgi:hypothetical protein